MTIQRHHLVTDFKQPGKTALQVLEANNANLRRKANAQCALEKICYVALVAICAVALAISYKVIVVTSAASAILAGLILASPLLIFAPTYLAQWSRLNKARAEFGEQVYKQLKQIEPWTRKNVEAFFDEYELDKSQLNHSYRDLLPLIAQTKCFIDRAQSSFCKAEQAMLEQEQKWKKEGGVSEEDKLHIRYETARMTHDRLEDQMLPDIIRTALLLRIIEKPTDTILDVDPFSLTMTGLGKCVPRSLALRTFGHSNDGGKNDDYFHFHPELERDPLEFQAILQKVTGATGPKSLALLRRELLPGAITG